MNNSSTDIKYLNSQFFVVLTESIYQKKINNFILFLNTLSPELSVLILRINLTEVLSVLWLLKIQIEQELANKILSCVLNLPRNPKNKPEKVLDDMISNILLYKFNFISAEPIENINFYIDDCKKVIWHRLVNILPDKTSLTLPELFSFKIPTNLNSYTLTRAACLSFQENKIIETAKIIRWLPFVSKNYSINLLIELANYMKGQYFNVPQMQFHLAVFFHLKHQLGK